MISATFTTNKYKRTAFLAVILLLLTLVGTKTASALTIEKTTDFTANELRKDASAFSLDMQMAVRIEANSFAQPLQVKIEQLNWSDFNFPSDWQVTSDIYSYELITSEPVDKDVTFDIFMNLRISTPQLKRIFVYNYEKQIFEEQEGDVESVYLVKSSLSALTGTVVILSDSTMLEYGEASWYKYKDCDCAASTYYPKGTLLNVKNLDNGKDITVKINDYGPVRAIFPERVIDLDKTAFAKLGILSRGLLKNVVVTKIK